MEYDPASLFESPNDSSPPYSFFCPPYLSTVRSPSPTPQTPPEHQTLSHFSSSEDQNPSGFSAEKPTAMGGTETEGSFLDGKAGATGIVGEIVGSMNNGEAGRDAKTGNSELSGLSGDSESPKIVGDKSCLKVRLRIRGFEKGDEIAKNAKQKDDHGNEGVRSSGGIIKEKSGERSKNNKNTENAEMQKDGPINEGTRSRDKRLKKRKMQEDSHGNEVGSSSGKKIVEIEDFRYVGDDDGKRRKLSPCLKWRETEAGKSLEKEKDLGECSKKNSGLPPVVEVNEDMEESWEKKSGLPPSLEGKQKGVGESSGEKIGWQELMYLLEKVRLLLKINDGGNGDVNYMQAAEDWGMSLVEPRIWERLRD